MRLSRLLGPIAMAALTAACGDQGPNAPPTATFTIQCLRLTCTATNGSADADGTIETYAWDFGDETEPVTIRDASHTYAAAGQFTVVLTVRDDAGETSTAEHAVSVDNVNRAPTAAFTLACTDLTCGFTDRSLDPDGQVVSYRWDFGDNSEPVTTRLAQHTYAESGPYTVQLTVQDGEGASATVTAQANPSHLNVLPDVRFSYSCTALTCDFKDLSYDFDGSISGHFWSFQDGLTSTEASPRHTFSSPGVYQVQLTATDDHGGTGSFTALVPAGLGADSFPTAPANAQVYERTTPEHIPGGGRSRYVLHPDGRFGLQYVSNTWGFFEYAGRYLRQGADITLDFDANAGRWWATGTVAGDSLIVEYNLDMQLSDFENGTYRLALPPQAAEDLAFSRGGDLYLINPGR